MVNVFGGCFDNVVDLPAIHQQLIPSVRFVLLSLFLLGIAETNKPFLHVPVAIVRKT